MAEGGLQVLDGTQLRNIDVTLSDELSGEITGNKVIEIAESRASEHLFSLSFPENLKSSALQRLNSEFRGDQLLDRAHAELLLRDYISAIADQLRDEPLVVSVLDGNTIRLFLEDEDDFAMLAENLFTDLDAEDEGKLSKNEIRQALVNMGVEMGVPPVSDFPMVNDILKKHGAEGEEKLGQAQFAQLLQPILQDLADALALKHVTVIQNVKITNGSKLKKVLADKNQFDDLIEKIYQQTCNCREEKGCAEIIRAYLENKGNELGLPPLEANEAVILLYDAVFSEIDNKKRAKTLLTSAYSSPQSNHLLLPSTRKLRQQDTLYCDSWRFTVETNDAGLWSTIPSICFDFVKDYVTGDRYSSDSKLVAVNSLEFAKSVNVSGDGKDSWVFDVDETLLFNLPYYQNHAFGSEVFDEKAFDEWMLLGEALVLPASLNLYKELQKLGFTIFILTGRSEPYRNATETNLRNVGYDNWKKLILRGPGDKHKSAVDYKSERRKALEDEGYRIRGNSGDQWSDLLGYAIAQRSFKLPNPMYYIA